MLRRLFGRLIGADGDDLPADPQDRADAIRERGRNPLEGGHDATERVVAALSDESPVVRVAAAETLAADRVYAEVVPADAVVDRLADVDRDVRLAAARALTVTTDGAAIGDIYDYALADDLGVRAAGALGLATALDRVPYEFTRVEIEALLDAVPEADRAADSETAAADVALAREYALLAIERGMPERTALDEGAVDRLVDVLETDDSPQNRATAARILGRCDAERAAAALSRASEDDPDGDVRAAAAEAVGGSGVG